MHLPASFPVPPHRPRARRHALPQVCDDASKFDTAALADHAQQVMQAELDRMYAAQDAATCAAPKRD